MSNSVLLVEFKICVKKFEKEERKNGILRLGTLGDEYDDLSTSQSSNNCKN